MSPSEASVLRAIAAAVQGSEATTSERKLGKVAEVSPATAHRLVESLRDGGFITVTLADRPGDLSRFTLTDAGRSALQTRFTDPLHEGGEAGLKHPMKHPMKRVMKHNGTTNGTTDSSLSNRELERRPSPFSVPVAVSNGASSTCFTDRVKQVIEAAVKHGLPVVVLFVPNDGNGTTTTDGTALSIEKKETATEERRIEKSSPVTPTAVAPVTSAPKRSPVWDPASSDEAAHAYELARDVLAAFPRAGSCVEDILAYPHELVRRALFHVVLGSANGSIKNGGAMLWSILPRGAPTNDWTENTACSFEVFAELVAKNGIELPSWARRVLGALVAQARERLAPPKTKATEPAPRSDEEEQRLDEALFHRTGTSPAEEFGEARARALCDEAERRWHAEHGKRGSRNVYEREAFETERAARAAKVGA